MVMKLSDFDDAIHIAQLLRRFQNSSNALDAATMESMDSVIVELRFLSTFLGYSHIWGGVHVSDHDFVANWDSLFTKVATVAKAFKKDLHNAFVVNYSDYYFTQMELELTTQLAAIWRKTRQCFSFCGSKPFELFHVFTCLDEQLGLLKPQIREALQFFSKHEFQPQPPFPNSNQTCAWEKFCDFVELNVKFLLETSYLPVHLAEQMEAFKLSLDSFKRLLQDIWISGSIRIQVMTHFRGVVIRLAHVCCFCWYAPLDQDRVKDIAVLLSQLRPKIDLSSPDFLNMILEFIGLYYVWNYPESVCRKYVAFFVHDMLGAREETVLHEELVALATFLLKKPEVHSLDVHIFSVDIKEALMEASYLKNKDHTTYIIDLVALFAKIWFIKADIFAKCRTDLPQSLNAQVKAIHEGSRFLIKSFSPAVEKTEYQIMKLIEDVSREVKSLQQSSLAGNLAGHNVRDLLYKFLVKIMLFKANALLLELLNNGSTFMLPLKPQIGFLFEGVVLIIESDSHAQNKSTEEEKLILTYMEAVAIRVKSICNSFSSEEVTEEAVKKLESRILNLLEMVQRLKAKLTEIYLKIPRLNFPTIPKLRFFEFFLQNLRQLLSSKHDSVAYPTHQIKAFYTDLESIISTFGNVIEHGIEYHECKDLHERLLVLVHEAECVIDLIVAENGAMGQHLLWLYDLSQEIRHIKIQLAYFYGNNTYDNGIHTVPHGLMPRLPEFAASRVEEVMVGLKDQKEVIFDRLTRGTLRRDLVSIVGMPGIGKTTLANNVFCSPGCIYHFHIRAWCYVSQTYRKRDLVLDILSDIIRPTDDILAMKDEDLDLMLYQHLKKKRYLIVMDDLWSTGAWDDLQRAFPDDLNGSRILMTSRMSDVVSKVSNPLTLRPFTSDESWELLKMKIFHTEQCPEELMEVGQQIAISCNGLPLAIGAVAGLLDRIDKNQEDWKEVAESVCSRIVNDPETRCKDILELSYNHLPDHLKACFLYLGAFSGDKDIPVQKLLCLWIAEGFICK